MHDLLHKHAVYRWTCHIVEAAPHTDYVTLLYSK